MSQCFVRLDEGSIMYPGLKQLRVDVPHSGRGWAVTFKDETQSVLKALRSMAIALEAELKEQGVEIEEIPF